MADLVNPTVITSGAYGGGMPPMGGSGYGGLLGGDGIGALLIGALLFGGGLGGFGRREEGRRDEGRGERETRIEDTVFDTAVLQKLGTIEGLIPAAACGVKDSVQAAAALLNTSTLQQTISLQQDLASLALGTQQGFANVKDSVQAGFVVTKDAVQNGNFLLSQALCGVNQNVSAQGCETRAAVQNDGDKTRAMLFARFQLEDATRINELNARVVELQNEHRRALDTNDLKISMVNTQVSNQAQAQAQQQQQHQNDLLRQIIAGLGGLTQIAHATNSNVIAGNSGAVLTGAQTANPTNVA
jgi:hypothetical protein